MTTTTSRPIFMTFLNYNPNLVFDARSRWQWCMRSSFCKKLTSL